MALWAVVRQHRAPARPTVLPNARQRKYILSRHSVCAIGILKKQIMRMPQPRLTQGGSPRLLWTAGRTPRETAAPLHRNASAQAAKEQSRLVHERKPNSSGHGKNADHAAERDIGGRGL